MRGAKLDGANFDVANKVGADLIGVALGNTSMVDVRR